MLEDLRDRRFIFVDRAHAGEVLAEMLAPRAGSNVILFAVPAGGVPVAAAVARCIDLALDVAVVSKITPPQSTEVGFGAVAFDGSVKLNEPLIPTYGLGKAEVQAGIERTRRKVRRRVELFRGTDAPPDVAGRKVVLVDDGLASGFTMSLAIQAMRSLQPAGVIVAVPTAPVRTAERIASEADEVYCPNLRGGGRFAVAEAYEHWNDVDEETARRVLEMFSEDRDPGAATRD